MLMFKLRYYTYNTNIMVGYLALLLPIQTLWDTILVYDVICRRPTSVCAQGSDQPNFQIHFNNGLHNLCVQC